MDNFGQYVRGLDPSSAEFLAFSHAVQAPGTLKAFAQDAGYPLTDDDADQIVTSVKLGAAAPGQDGLLSESMLDGINGGVNWAAVGALAGGAIAGVAAGIVVAPAAAGAAALWGVGMVVGAVGGGGAVGAVGGAIVNAVKGD